MYSLKLSNECLSHLNWKKHEKRDLKFNATTDNLVYVFGLDGWNQQISVVHLGDREAPGRGAHGPLYSLLW